jgi:hypothetical protein
VGGWRRERRRHSHLGLPQPQPHPHLLVLGLLILPALFGCRGVALPPLLLHLSFDLGRGHRSVLLSCDGGHLVLDDARRLALAGRRREVG